MKSILVIGRAKDTWKEVDNANRLVGATVGPFDSVVAINDAGYDYPHVDHWVSFHGDKFEQWLRIRRGNGFEPAQLWTSTYGRKESAYERKLHSLGVRRLNYTGGGSSGLVGVLIALIHLQATHVVLAGIPMDIEAGHYNQDGPWKEAVKHRKAWREKLDNLMPNVRSMSGWTSEQLGVPDRAWLHTTHPVKNFKV